MVIHVWAKFPALRISSSRGHCAPVVLLCVLPRCRNCTCGLPFDIDQEFRVRDSGELCNLSRPSCANPHCRKASPFKMAAAVEQTYIMIKPDGVQRGLVSGPRGWHATGSLSFVIWSANRSSSPPHYTWDSLPIYLCLPHQRPSRGDSALPRGAEKGPQSPPAVPLKTLLYTLDTLSLPSCRLSPRDDDNLSPSSCGTRISTLRFTTCRFARMFRFAPSRSARSSAASRRRA